MPVNFRNIQALFASAMICSAWGSQTLAAPTNEACNNRINGTVDRLLECIQQQPLYQHLIDFQDIANNNPDPQGHGNRNTGSKGYRASVDYVETLMRDAGYKVTVQSYTFTDFQVLKTPSFSTSSRTYDLGRDWYVARLSGSGGIDAPVQPVGHIVIDGSGASSGGCTVGDFKGFRPGNVALIQRGGCNFDTKVANAVAAGASGVILFNSIGVGVRDDQRGMPKTGVAFPALLTKVAPIPVVGSASYAVGLDLYQAYQAGNAPVVRLNIETRSTPETTDYNLIADSPYGDPDHIVVAEGHLDAIYGAGILDNASGSSTLIEIALKLAKTPTLNQLRYIWFGGEELGLLGSHYYTRHLSKAELARIVYDIDADVTATPNYAMMIADPQGAYNVQDFPPNVVPQSRRGDNYFLNYFGSTQVSAVLAPGGNDGTDSNSFSLVGVPNTGIFTQQDCCKNPGQVARWGGFLGNYEGKIPSFNGGCVDYPGRWCDNLDNNSAYVLEFTSKGVAYVTFELANDRVIDHYKR